jgi:glycosyltransferase involved in cell wall biosynthesis
MSPTEIIGDDMRRRSMFLVWGPPSHGPRSRVFARELGIPLHNVYSTRRRGKWIAPWKYGYQAIVTLLLLVRHRPRLVFVQSPPSFASILVAGYSVVTRARFIIDAHSGALQSSYWTRPRWLYHRVARRALATIVTNDTFAALVTSWGARSLVLRDIPTSFPTGEDPALLADFDVMVVNTFAPDEPLSAVTQAAGTLPHVTFHVTGDPDRGRVHFDRSRVPDNVRFTGYLPDEDYYALMRAADVVMCLTTRDDTMQRGACEALSIGTPIITSDWPLLRRYFNDGTVHVGSDSSSIARGVMEAAERIDELRVGILRLREEQSNEWLDASEALASLIRG